MDEYNSKLSEEIIESVRTISNDDDKDIAIKSIAMKLGINYQQSSMLVETITIVIRNDYLLLDMFLGTINAVLSTLRLRQCITDEDIESIKEEISKYNE